METPTCIAPREPAGRCRGDAGAGLVEYALLLALIVVACIGAVTFLGDQPQQQPFRDRTHRSPQPASRPASTQQAGPGGEGTPRRGALSRVRHGPCSLECSGAAPASQAPEGTRRRSPAPAMAAHRWWMRPTRAVRNEAYGPSRSGAAWRLSERSPPGADAQKAWEYPNDDHLRIHHRLAPGPMQDRPWRLARRVRPPRGPDRRRVHRRRHPARQERLVEVLAGRSLLSSPFGIRTCERL